MLHGVCHSFRIVPMHPTFCSNLHYQYTSKAGIRVAGWNFIGRKRTELLLSLIVCRRILCVCYPPCMAYSKDEKSFLAQLGHNIRKIRESKGWSQEEFAFRVVLHRTYISEIERGRRNVSLLNIRKIAKTLDAQIVDIFPPN